MTRKEAQRRLAVALREQRAAQEEVRGANARVVEETSKLPPHYVDEHRRFAPGERARIQKLIDRAQRASERLANATSDVVNLRGLVASQRAQKMARGGRHHATKRHKTSARLDREIAEALSRRRRTSHAIKSYDKDDARAFGRFAYRMEQTKQQALSSARFEGFRKDQLEAVAEGWEAERRDTSYGGFAGTSHATRRKPGKVRELKELQQARDRYLQALGYAGNTPEQVHKYHAAIEEIDAKLRFLR